MSRPLALGRRDRPRGRRLGSLVPSLHRIRVQLGHAHKESGDLHNAGLAYHAVLKHTPLDDDLHLQIGHLEKLRGNADRAAAAYRKSVELNPGNGNAVIEYFALTLPGRVEAIVAREQSQIIDSEASRGRYWPNEIVAGSTAGEYMAASNALARDLLHPDFQEFCRVSNTPFILGRKFWEWAFIYDRLKKVGFLRPGMRGLGFGVGTEGLPSFFASLGVNITATDAPAGQNWDDTSETSDHKNRLFNPTIIDRASFDDRVGFEYCDMNDIPGHLTNYDFCWSSCSFEHLGTLQHGLDFVLNSIEKTLKVGGIACHTTELNLSSDDETIEAGATVIYRKKDLERFRRTLDWPSQPFMRLRAVVPPSYAKSSTAGRRAIRIWHSIP